MGSLERHHVVGTSLHRPSQFVHRTMVSAAEGDEIREVGLSSPPPVDHVVNLGEVDKGTAGEATAFVPAGDLNPLGAGGTPAHPFLIEDGAIAVLDREHALGVPRQPSRHLGRDRTDARQVGATIGMRTGQKSQIGVHNHSRAISAPSIAGTAPLAVRAVGTVGAVVALAALGAAGGVSAAGTCRSAWRT